MQKKKIASAGVKSVSGTPYDDVFRTLMVKCPELMIPLINEAFDMHYGSEEPVLVYHNEFYAGGRQKRVTDAYMGIRHRRYHIECQSTSDGTVMVRMFEYDAQIALESFEQKRNKVRFTFPHSMLLYLRSSVNTPKRMKVTVRVPGDRARYKVPVMKVSEYSAQELLDKDLVFLIPFHLFRYEKEMKLYGQEKEWLEKLKGNYRKIVRYLSEKVADMSLTALQCRMIQEMTKKIAESLAADHAEVREGVIEIMGGQVLELECEKFWKETVEESRRKGAEQGIAQGLAALVKTLKPLLHDEEKIYEAVIANEAYADVTREKVMEYYMNT